MKPKEIDLGFKIDEEKVKLLDLPAEEILISEIIANADIPYLEKEGTDDWNLSPNELIRNFENEPTHADWLQKVDLSFPIAIYNYKGKWIIIDGVHRFTKALMLKNEKILVKKVPDELIESLKK